MISNNIVGNAGPFHVINSPDTYLEQFDKDFWGIQVQESLLTAVVVGCHRFQGIGGLHLNSDIAAFDEVNKRSGNNN